MTIDSQIHEVELSIEQARKAITTKQAMARLLENKDFKEIMTEGYFVQEASRLVALLADMQMQTPEMQDSIQKQIVAIGHFRQYIRTIFQMGASAERAMAADEQTLEELNQENVEA